jgi:hypothetical protein
MARSLSAEEAAALLRPRDTFAMPLGPGQPPALLEGLSKREDWEELRIGTALLFVLSPLFNHPNVHYLQGEAAPALRVRRSRNRASRPPRRAPGGRRAGLSRALSTEVIDSSRIRLISA